VREREKPTEEEEKEERNSDHEGNKTETVRFESGMEEKHAHF